MSFPLWRGQIQRAGRESEIRSEMLSAHQTNNRYLLTTTKVLGERGLLLPGRAKVPYLNASSKRKRGREVRGIDKGAGPIPYGVQPETGRRTNRYFSQGIEDERKS